MKAERSIERSIDSLQRIYAVVVGLAINEGIKRFFLANNNQFEFPTANWPQFIAFMITIIPFLHGMNRHLDRTLAEARKTGKRSLLIILLIDFMFFIGESCFFVSLAATVTKSDEFFRLLLYLLVADVGWVCFTFPVSKSFSWRWLSINIITSCCIGFLLFGQHRIPPGWKPSILCGVAFLRSILDYLFVWDFYFPPDDPIIGLATASPAPKIEAHGRLDLAQAIG
jgi:hypothetical protein